MDILVLVYLIIAPTLGLVGPNCKAISLGIPFKVTIYWFHVKNLITASKHSLVSS